MISSFLKFKRDPDVLKQVSHIIMITLTGSIPKFQGIILNI